MLPHELPTATLWNNICSIVIKLWLLQNSVWADAMTVVVCSKLTDASRCTMDKSLLINSIPLQRKSWAWNLRHETTSFLPLFFPFFLNGYHEQNFLSGSTKLHFGLWISCSGMQIANQLQVSIFRTEKKRLASIRFTDQLLNRSKFNHLTMPTKKKGCPG